LAAVDRTGDIVRGVENFLINYMPEEVEKFALPIQFHRLYLHVTIGESRQKKASLPAPLL
jgi:hypothetical protein